MKESGVLPPPSKDHEIEEDGGKVIRYKDGKATGKATLFSFSYCHCILALIFVAFQVYSWTRR